MDASVLTVGLPSSSKVGWLKAILMLWICFHGFHCADYELSCPDLHANRISILTGTANTSSLTNFCVNIGGVSFDKMFFRVRQGTKQEDICTLEYPRCNTTWQIQGEQECRCIRVDGDINTYEMKFFFNTTAYTGYNLSIVSNCAPTNAHNFTSIGCDNIQVAPKDCHFCTFSKQCDYGGCLALIIIIIIIIIVIILFLSLNQKCRWVPMCVWCACDQKHPAPTPEVGSLVATSKTGPAQNKEAAEHTGKGPGERKERKEMTELSCMKETPSPSEESERSRQLPQPKGAGNGDSVGIGSPPRAVPALNRPHADKLPSVERNSYIAANTKPRPLPAIGKREQLEIAGDVSLPAIGKREQ